MLQASNHYSLVHTCTYVAIIVTIYLWTLVIYDRTSNIPRQVLYVKNVSLAELLAYTGMNITAAEMDDKHIYYVNHTIKSECSCRKQRILAF